MVKQWTKVNWTLLFLDCSKDEVGLAALDGQTFFFFFFFLSFLFFFLPDLFLFSCSFSFFLCSADECESDLQAGAVFVWASRVDFAAGNEDCALSKLPGAWQHRVQKPVLCWAGECGHQEIWHGEGRHWNVQGCMVWSQVIAWLWQQGHSLRSWSVLFFCVGLLCLLTSKDLILAPLPLLAIFRNKRWRVCEWPPLDALEVLWHYFEVIGGQGFELPHLEPGILIGPCRAVSNPTSRTSSSLWPLDLWPFHFTHSNHFG